MDQVAPRLDRIQAARFDLSGFVGERIRENAENWLLRAPDANPAMLQILRDRDRQPVRDLVPWAGEFAGKYLTFEGDFSDVEAVSKKMGEGASG